MKLPEGNSDDGGRRLRVLLAIDGLGPGGAERQFCLLCRGLKEIADVSVWAFHGGVMAAELEAMGIPRLIGMAEGRNRCQAIGTALSLSSGFRPDIIHSWGWISSFLMEAASRRQGSAVHVTGLVRMGTLPSRKRLRLYLASRLGCLSIGNSAAGLRAWGIPCRRARLVANGFDPARLSGLSRPSGIEKPFTVIMAGSMASHKDFSSLVRAAAILRIRAPGRFVFNLLGDGRDRVKLRKLAQESGCGDSVFFPGRTGSIIPWLYESHAGILLSPLGEGMSNFLMECMASGLPVLCTAGGGNPELVRDSVDGFILPKADPGLIADRLLLLANDPGMCERMGGSGRERILAGFTAEKMVGATVDVYREALALKGRSSR